MASKAPPPPPLNPWEAQALDYQFPNPPNPADLVVEGKTVVPQSKWRKLEDPIMYPGLYSASGFDIMDIMLRIMRRPNPQIELGAVDCSVSLVLCDLELPDAPIVYASDSFCDMTGYAKAEVLGRNCRFLQAPPGGKGASSSKPGSGADKYAVRKLRHAIDARKEIQLELVNYKKNGQRFNNILSVIPLELDVPAHHYAVGFQVEVDRPTSDSMRTPCSGRDFLHVFPGLEDISIGRRLTAIRHPAIPQR